MAAGLGPRPQRDVLVETRLAITHRITATELIVLNLHQVQAASETTMIAPPAVGSCLTAAVVAILANSLAAACKLPDGAMTKVAANCVIVAAACVAATHHERAMERRTSQWSACASWPPRRSSPLLVLLSKAYVAVMKTHVECFQVSHAVVAAVRGQGIGEVEELGWAVGLVGEVDMDDSARSVVMGVGCVGAWGCGAVVVAPVVWAPYVKSSKTIMAIVQAPCPTT
ncbi:hypothetical protein CYMTET_10743 [Cymbomonas tetramitiformis]|uniref:Uncharacterized protein n=1 Tax=Cymbomonas tetramitiformis TaxID=36881 RepID=A0AAE0LDJ0_9CHLO|nr:hypothetical protein CYMTET_10743 [Cymbomonas tetramitiformis]